MLRVFDRQAIGTPYRLPRQLCIRIAEFLGEPKTPKRWTWYDATAVFGRDGYQNLSCICSEENSSIGRNARAAASGRGVAQVPSKQYLYLSGDSSLRPALGV